MFKVNSGQNLDEDVHIIKDADGDDIYIFDPHNPLNIEITQKDVENTLSSYGIDVPIHNFH